MSVTWYAALVVMVGLALWLKGNVLGSVVGVLFFSLFGGGAAFVAGTASIQPVYFFLLFLLAHVLFSMFTRSDHINIGFKTNGYLVFYCIFGAMTAFILPKLFAKSMEIPPMLINNANTYYTAPLGPSKQNVTTAIYLIGTLIASVCAGAATIDPKSRRTIVVWGMIISWMHIGFGLLGLIATKVGGGTEILHFFRNATYAELIEANQGFIRINGIFPEPSAYGAYAFFWLVFMVELWLREVMTRWTGLTAAALLLIVAACTSTSTYFGLGSYAGVLLARWMIAPGRPRVGKIVLVGMGGLSALCLILAVVAFVPSAAEAAGRLLSSLTLHKLSSSSGEQRLFWAKAGIKAFVVSHGLGVGAGSFRCSSLLFSIMGSTGVIGTLAFGGHVLKILPPLRAKTDPFAAARRDAVGEAAAWAACAGLLPAMVSAPTPDPDILFAVLGGLALGWRFLAERDQPFARQSTVLIQRGAAADAVAT